MKTIAELRQMNLPVMTQTDFVKVEQGTGTVENMNRCVEAINEYLKAFAKSENPGRCISCGTTMGGMFGSLMGGWQHGIAHGEGECGECGYPGRTVHIINDKDGEHVVTVSPLILQYHPDFVDETESKN